MSFLRYLKPRAIWKRALHALPIVTRKYHEQRRAALGRSLMIDYRMRISKVMAAHARERESWQTTREQDQREHIEALARILDYHHQCEVSRDPSAPRYHIKLAVDAYMIGLLSAERTDMARLAHVVSRTVVSHIVNSRFVEPPRKSGYAEWDRGVGSPAS